MKNQNIMKFYDYDGRPIVFDFIERKVYFYSGLFQKQPKYTVSFNNIKLDVRKEQIADDFPKWYLILYAEPITKQYTREQELFKKLSKWQKFLNFLKPEFSIETPGNHRIVRSFWKQRVYKIAKELEQKCSGQLTVSPEVKTDKVSSIIWIIALILGIIVGLVFLNK